MSYGAAVYRLNFNQLLAVRGSQDTALLADLMREYPEGADDDDYDEEEEEEEKRRRRRRRKRKRKRSPRC